MNGAQELAASGPGTNYAIDDPFTAARTAWWRQDRFGMFIHFGAYSHYEGEYTSPSGSVCRDAEWIKRNCNIPIGEYEQFAKTFNPSGFDADAIATLAKDAGQRYIVITSKHHEGYAMWPTKVNTWNLRDHSAFDKTRDILAELKRASDARGVKLGFYYSIWDWHDPDFPNASTFPKYKERMYAQLKELVDNYHPAVFWFDGEWDTTNPYNPWRAEDGEQLEAYLRGLDPNLVINNRVGKRRVADGDTGTPEQEIPNEPVLGQLWESCMTINGSWGYARHDQNWKSVTDLTRKLTTIASRSGNYLLNVGPDALGRVPTEAATRLRGMGSWLGANGQSGAVYQAESPGVVDEPSWGVVSRRGSKLYASVFNWPASGGSLTLHARASFNVTGARVLGSSQTVSATRSGDTVTIRPSGSRVGDPTVIELGIATAAATPVGSGTGLSAQFWPNANFSGEPTVRRTDARVNYNWKFTGSPAAQIPAEAFSSRWTGSIEPRYSEPYTFVAMSDDTVRLWIDGQLVIDNTSPHGPQIDRGTVTLQAGHRHTIRLEQTERGGEASMKLLWMSPNTLQEIVPATQLYPSP
ncbi:alpha-L-fucosidase [Pendulispora rubella]|uniref:alpha-L-fucosidase n=1 Tax=Pendulispora rubella TaxID=2741070 RepID=A0ABZ2L3K5_9BACT